LSAVPLALEEWLKRDLPPPDRLMGEWLTTTSRVLINAPTGIGKSNLALALAGHIAAGRDFLHWRAHRSARVLFIDGEMSRRLLKQRAIDVTRRLGLEPADLFLLSHEDIEGFQPLNTPAGRAFINAVIEKIGGVEVIVFDNVMSLTAGDMREEEGWRAVLPLVDALTKHGIGQVWIHHTGHDENRGYGTKTREWRMDTVIHLTEQERADTDISFVLEFRKARERTPETRRDFEDVTIALVNDEWTWQAAEQSAAHKDKVSPVALKFLGALCDATSTKVLGHPAATFDQWRTECVRRGLIEAGKANRDRALFSKYKLELVVANRIACNETTAWVLNQT
jgi:hypothetical protein